MEMLVAQRSGVDLARLVYYQPELWILGRLYPLPPVGHPVDRPDIRIEIVKHEVDVFHADDQYEMMLAEGGEDLGQEQRTRWPAEREQFMAFGHSIVVAVAGPGRHRPLLGQQVVLTGLREDVAIDLVVYGIQLVPACYRQRDVAMTEVDPANFTVFRELELSPNLGDE